VFRKKAHAATSTVLSSTTSILFQNGAYIYTIIAANVDKDYSMSSS